MMLQGQKSDHVLWNDGTETYTYLRSVNQYKKDVNLNMGIVAATGISGGASYTIPSLMLENSPGSVIAALSNLALLPQEDFEGTQCYVITGKNPMGLDYKLWIGVNDYLFRKCEWTVKSYQEARKQFESTLKTKTIEDRAKLPDLSAMPDHSSVTQEIHRSIKVNETISDSTFKFTPPGGARLVENLR